MSTESFAATRRSAGKHGWFLRGIVKDAGKSAMGRKAALLALDDLARISDRFGREEEIAAAQRELRKSLRR